MRGRRVLGLVTATVAVAASLVVGPTAGPAGAEPCAPPTVQVFSDVPLSHAFCAEITAASQLGFIGGYFDGTFRPANAITRQAVAAMLARLLVGTDPLSPCSGPVADDVPASQSFCPYIALMYAEGVMGGYPDGTFRPGANITRQAVAAAMTRILVGDGPLPACLAPGPFPDVPVTHPFCAEIQAAADANIITGYLDGTFRPGQSITRQAFAAMLMRLASQL